MYFMYPFSWEFDQQILFDFAIDGYPRALTQNYFKRPDKDDTIASFWWYAQTVYMAMHEECGTFLKENFGMSSPPRLLIITMSIITFASPLLFIYWGYIMVKMSTELRNHYSQKREVSTENIEYDPDFVQVEDVKDESKKDK